MSISDILLLLLLALILFLAIAAIIHGYKGIKNSKNFTGKKIRITCFAASLLHFCAGILISVIYVIMIIFFVISYINFTGA